MSSGGIGARMFALDVMLLTVSVWNSTARCFVYMSLCLVFVYIRVLLIIYYILTLCTNTTWYSKQSTQKSRFSYTTKTYKQYRWQWKFLRKLLQPVTTIASLETKILTPVCVLPESWRQTHIFTNVKTFSKKKENSLER